MAFSDRYESVDAAQQAKFRHRDRRDIRNACAKPTKHHEMTRKLVEITASRLDGSVGIHRYGTALNAGLAQNNRGSLAGPDGEHWRCRMAIRLSVEQH